MRTSEGKYFDRCSLSKAREAGLRWFGQVQRRDRENVGRRVLRMELPERRAISQ